MTPDIRSTNLDKEPVNMLYVPYWQRSRLGAALLVRTAMDPRSIANAVRAAVWEIDREVTVPEVRTLEEVLSLGGGAAVPNTAGGTVRRRRARARGLRHLRRAVLCGHPTDGRDGHSDGAGRAALATCSGMVLRQGMPPVFVGLAGGAASALALGRYLESLLFQVSPRDPLAFAISGAVLLAGSVAACLIPARRATRVSPRKPCVSNNDSW